MKKKIERERYITFLSWNQEIYAWVVREMQIYSKIMRIRKDKNKDKRIEDSDIQVASSGEMKR